MTGEADYCESGGNTVKGYRIELAGPDGIFDNGFVLIGVGNELGNELACVNVAVVDTSVDVNKRFAGAVEGADEAAGFNSALNCPVVETVDYGEGGAAAGIAYVRNDTARNAGTGGHALFVCGNVAVVDTSREGKGSDCGLVKRIGKYAARMVGSINITVVGAVFVGGGLSCVAVDTACAGCGCDVAVIEAVAEDYVGCSAVSDYTAGNKVCCGNVALVVAAVKQVALILGLTADTADGFRTGHICFVGAADEGCKGV